MIQLLTIQNIYTSSYRILGSKFLGIAFPSSDIHVFDDHLSSIKKEYPDATHHCYAWRINPFQVEEFSQDDGEPSGTAGLPILNTLRSADLCNCGIVVIRYYGGTKLGKSGLIDAYGTTAKLALEQAVFHPLIPAMAWKIRFDYSQKRLIDSILQQTQAKEHEAEYLEHITAMIHVPVAQNDAFKKAVTEQEWQGILFEECGSVLM